MLACVQIRGTLMPKFVIEREVPGAGKLSDAQLQEISRKSMNVLKGMGPEIQWLHSYVTGDKVYCIYLAPDEATIQEHARRIGLPANRISAVRRLIDPTTAEYEVAELRGRPSYLPESVRVLCASARGRKTRASAPLQSLSQPATSTLRTKPSLPPCRSMPALPGPDVRPVWLVPP